MHVKLVRNHPPGRRLKTGYFWIFLLFCSSPAFSQEKLVKDLDGDRLNDTVYLENNRIVCRLSTQHFQPARSLEIEFIGEQNAVRETKSGFELASSFMRAGHACQFRYDTSAQKIRLIGMSVYEFGNAANDGSGEGSVNLLTNNYVGNWNAFDNKKQKLVKLPEIKVKLTYAKTFLESFDGKLIDKFMEKSAKLYEDQKAQIVR